MTFLHLHISRVIQPLLRMQHVSRHFLSTSEEIHGKTREKKKKKRKREKGNPWKDSFVGSVPGGRHVDRREPFYEPSDGSS